jgi:hypothetical protein
MQVESASRHLNHNVGVPAAAKHVLSTSAPASYVPWGQSEIGMRPVFDDYFMDMSSASLSTFSVNRCVPNINEFAFQKKSAESSQTPPGPDE